MGGTAAGARARRGAIPVTRFKEMEEGETSYPMAREDRETAVIEEERQAWRAKRADEVVGMPRRMCLHQAE